MITASKDFWDATEIARILNGVGFADKAATADVGLFCSRVDANIVSRMKKAKSAPRTRQSTRARPAASHEALRRKTQKN